MPRGYILSDSGNVVVIATLASNNAKTGNMIQVWILRNDVSPVDAVQTGKDSAICGSCPHRGTLGSRTCYVNVSRAPMAIFRAYQSGKYPFLQVADYASVFGGRAVRLGAYGDPAFMPLSIIREITASASKWTGYTHQWRVRPDLQPFVMASVDSANEAAMASAAGWRYFRVMRHMSEVSLSREITCPASDEAGKRTQCIRCSLCNGKPTETDRRANINILAHGQVASRLINIQ